MGHVAFERRPARPATVHLALVAVQLGFSGFHVFAKQVLHDLPPMAVALVRVGITAPLLLGLAWQHDRLIPPRRTWPALALLGLLGIFTNQVLFLYGLRLASATTAAILMPAIPVFTAGLAAALGIEPPTWKRGLGIALTVAGALAVLDPRRLMVAGPATIGALMILCNCLAYAGFLVLQRPVLLRLPWRTVIAWSFLFGGIGIAFPGVPAAATVPWAHLSWTTIAALLYVALIGTAAAYALNTWAVSHSSPSLAAAYTTLQPIGTAGLAAIVLGERVGVPEAIGCTLIVLGLLLVARDRPAAERAFPDEGSAGEPLAR